jgi:uncharacterized membrane protein
MTDCARNLYHNTARTSGAAILWNLSKVASYPQISSIIDSSSAKDNFLYTINFLINIMSNLAFWSLAYLNLDRAPLPRRHKPHLQLRDHVQLRSLITVEITAETTAAADIPWAGVLNLLGIITYHFKVLCTNTTPCSGLQVGSITYEQKEAVSAAWW